MQICIFSNVAVLTFFGCYFGHNHVHSNSNLSPLKTQKKISCTEEVVIQKAKILLPAFSSKVELEELNLKNARPDSL